METEVRKEPKEQRNRFWHAHYVVELLIRFALAYEFLVYGLAKWVGTQFLHAGTPLDQTVRSLSGFELTWVYFGYSTTYAYFIGGGQILGAVLLVFERTKRLGAVVLLPIISNIVMINYLYGITATTQLLSLLFLGGVLFILASDIQAFWQFFWQKSSDERKMPGFLANRKSWLTVIAVLFLLGASYKIHGMLSSSQSKYISVLFGDWKVEKVEGQPSQLPSVKSLREWKYVYIKVAGMFEARSKERIDLGRIRIKVKERTFSVHYRKEQKETPKGKAQRRPKKSRFHGTFRLGKAGRSLVLQGKLDKHTVTLHLQKRIWPKP